MLPAWLAISFFLAFMAALTLLARWGDRDSARPDPPRLRKAVYALGICVYCSSWSFFGSVGTASRHGLDFLPLYLGPIIVFALFYPLVMRMIRISKAQNITSIADFVAVRYGKATPVAVTVASIVTIGSIPYIAMQIHWVAKTLGIFLDGTLPPETAPAPGLLLGALVALVFTAFTIAVSQRRLDPGDTHRGLMLVVAAGSLVKLAAFLVAGIFVCWWMFKGFGDLTERVLDDEKVSAIIDSAPSPSLWLSMAIFSSAATLVLPRQFHVGVVENQSEADVRTAAWLVPLYVIAISYFVMPIAAAGLTIFPHPAFQRELTILALPIHANAGIVTAIVLLGIVAAAITSVTITAMATGVMISNDLVMPFFLGQGRPIAGISGVPPILTIRRLSIAALMVAAWLASATFTNPLSSSLAPLSLACIVQIAPAALGGMFWSRATARGAIGGSVTGFIIWGYTLLLPVIGGRTSALVMEGPLGLDALRPTDLFRLDIAPFQQGLVWSLGLNILVYVVLSLSRPANTNERLQANVFVGNKPMALASAFRLRPFTVSNRELIATVSRYLGGTPAEPLFAAYHEGRDLRFDPSEAADAQILKYAEHLIASTIGAASSRAVIARLLEPQDTPKDAALRIVDDVAFEIQNSHDVLQHAIDIARDGMAVFDRDLRLIAWNRAYRDMFGLPPDLLRVGVALDVLVRSNAERGVYGLGSADEFVASRLETLTRPTDGARLYSALMGRVLEMHSVRLHNGGLFFTYTDATEQVKSEAELEAENITLEQRVRERTEELQTLNFELARAKAEAEDANISKTRFLAAASHDLLQPLNAARLYTTSLRERLRGPSTLEDTAMLATNIDSSLEAVEDILSALLEISHLDAGATKTEITSFPIEVMLRQLQIEFQPMARERGLRLRIASSSIWVLSDRKLLRRLLQNLVSNAIKYTSDGGVLVGVRRMGRDIRVDIIDTGVGIPEEKQGLIFREFERLPPATRAAPGAGLGLSIVERLGRVLKHEVTLRSAPGKGSVFSVALPGTDASVASGSAALSFSVAQKQRSLEGLAVAAIDNEPPILRGMETLLQGWDCVVASGLGLAEIEAALLSRGIVPDVIVADYHIGDVDGLGVIDALRRRYGPCPAVLITADRSAAVKDLAAAADVRLLHKPLKPAALRALLSQWRLVKTAAE